MHTARVVAVWQARVESEGHDPEQRSHGNRCHLSSGMQVFGDIEQPPVRWLSG